MRRLYLAVWIPVLVVSSVHAQVNLLAARTYAVGNAPRSVVAADLNGDGKADLVVANQNDNTISVLLSNGDGTFKPAVAYATGQALYLSVADFNGDGKPDIAVAPCESIGTSPMVCVLAGKGDGTFQAPVSFSVSSSAVSLVAGDFNSDGKPDLVAGTPTGIDVLLGNGDGTFQAPKSFTDGNYAVYLVARDFNQDGKLDLAITGGKTSNTTIFILKGNGDGTFQSGPSYTFDTGVDVGPLAAADMNRDGILDLIVSNNVGPAVGVRPAVSVMMGNGDATFSGPVSYGSSASALGVTVSDFNGDGKPDVAVADQSINVVHILFGQGNGTLQTGPDYAVGAIPLFIAAGDFNGDGKPDLATANEGSNDTSIVLSNGNGTFQAASSLPLGPDLYPGYEIASIVLDDFNEDGKLDFATSFDGVTIGAGAGDGTFPVITALKTSIAGGIAVADLNRDGHLDIAGGNMVMSAGGVYVATLLGNGDSTFQPEIDSWARSRQAQYTVSAQLIPGDPGDLIVASNNFGGSAMLGDGTGHFTLASPDPISASYRPVIADFNGDGIQDLLQFDAEVLFLSLGVGDGTFLSATVLAKNIGDATVADLNGDGIPDIVGLGSGVTVFLGNGDGTFQGGVSYALPGLTARVVAVADMNQDGIPDVVVAFSSGVEVLLGNGDGTLQTPIVFGSPYGTPPVAMAIGDINGDGLPDVVIEQLSPTVTAQINLYLSQKGALTPSVVTLTSALNPASAGESVQFTATVAGSGVSGTPTGTITFQNGLTSLGSAPLSAGSASITVSTLPTGNNTLTAVYSGDSTFAGTTSAGLIEVINGSPFTVAPSDGGNETVTSGQAATFPLTLTPGTATNQTVTLSCSGAPPNSTCTISPTSITLSGTAAQSATVTVQTMSSASASLVHPAPTNLNPFFVLGAGFVFWLAMAGGSVRRVRRLGVVLSLCLAISACGGGSNNGGPTTHGTPAGVYTLVVTAQGSSFSQAINLKLTVN